MYYGIIPDYLYIVLVVPALILSLICQANIKSTYRKMDKIANRRGITGAQAAKNVLSSYGIYNVAVNQISGSLTDHYDPRTNCINLSSAVYNGSSVAAVGIAAHEAGHAAQHAEGYTPIRIRNKILPVANIGSTAGLLLCVVGYFLGFGILSDIGIFLFGFVVLFQLVTLPVEFNASSRALSVIKESGMLYEDEYPKCKKVLTAAAMTYVASLLVSLGNFLRILIRFRGRRR